VRLGWKILWCSKVGVAKRFFISNNVSHKKFKKWIEQHLAKKGSHSWHSSVYTNTLQVASSCGLQILYNYRYTPSPSVVSVARLLYCGLYLQLLHATDTLLSSTWRFMFCPVQVTLSKHPLWKMEETR
jgi:hypothetical protein